MYLQIEYPQNYAYVRSHEPNGPLHQMQVLSGLQCDHNLPNPLQSIIYDMKVKITLHSPILCS